MRLMVLGGGSCQQNFIKRAKKAGHFVIVVDYLQNCPAKQDADVHLQISTFDTDEVRAAAKANEIDGIVTLGTDQPVLTAAIVAQELGLNFYADGELALAVTNKRVMKKWFTDNDIPTAKYQLIGEDFADGDIDDLAFPAVLKPVDSQGQRGIFLVHSKQEVRAHIAETHSHSREDRVLLEQFYASDELTVNGWVSGGEVTMISVVDRVTMKNTARIGICVAHNFPSVYLEKHRSEIDALTKRIVSAFGIQNGPIYFQYLLGADGIKVNEIAMRIGGAYEDLTIPMLSGIDIGGMLLEYIESGRCDTKQLDEYRLVDNKACLSTQMFFCKPGRVRYITPKDELLALPGVEAASYAIGKGSEIGDIQNATARAGYFVVKGKSFEIMMRNVNRVFETLEVRGEDGENLVIKYCDYADKYLFV